MIYISLFPTKEYALQLYRLANADIVRADCHITLKFDPNPAVLKKIKLDIEEFLKLFGDKKSSNLIYLPLSSIVSVQSDNALLQFLTVDMIRGEEGKFLSNQLQNKNLHVTLGSTDANILAHAHSCVVCSKLLEMNNGNLEIFEKEASDIRIKIPKSYSNSNSNSNPSGLMEVSIRIEPFQQKGKDIKFTGVGVANCISR